MADPIHDAQDKKNRAQGVDTGPVEENADPRDNIDPASSEGGNNEPDQPDNTKGSGKVTMTGGRETPLPDDHEES